MFARSITYNHYGYAIRSDVPLGTIRDNLSFDLLIEHIDDPLIDSTPPPGRILRRHEYSDEDGVTITELDDGTQILRFHNHCDFVISPDRRHVVCHRNPKQEKDYTPLFITGNLIAYILYLRGEHTLHASSIVLGDSAIAFAGPSGTGKSTMAALSCLATGAALLTDDLLRFDERDGRFHCYPGIPELRLRPGAAELATGSPHRSYQTVDDRTALQMPTVDADARPLLKAIVLPRPDHENKQPRVERLAPMDSLLRLSAEPRVLAGRNEHASMKQQFEWVGRLVRAVPVYEAHVPWGPPFDFDAIRKILDEVRSRG